MNPSTRSPKQPETNGAVCGGVVKQSEFEKDPWGYMMAYIMPDDKFEQYKSLKEAGDRKAASKFFDEHARSAI